MLNKLKKVFHDIGDLVLLNNVKFRENNNFKDHKHAINKRIIELVLGNTIMYVLIVLAYIFVGDKDEISFIFIKSAIILYGVYYTAFIASLASYRNLDCLRHPCNRAECSIGTANYFKKILLLSKISLGINVFSIILLFIVVVL